MELPTDLNVWNLETINIIVEKHEFEPGFFDYKSILHATGDNRNEHRDSIRRTACSMANTDGGFILFGILDRKQTVTSLADRVIGIPIQNDLRKEFGDKIADLQPEIYFETIPRVLQLPDKPNRGIFVVHIPQSPRRPHMVLSTGIYYHRGENGAAVPMNHYEVRNLMMYTEERLRKVLLFRFEIKIFRREALKLLEMQNYNHEVLATFYHLDVENYKKLLTDISIILPSSIGVFEQFIKITIYIDKINKMMNAMQYMDTKFNIAAITTLKFIHSKKFKQLDKDFKAYIKEFDEQCFKCEIMLDKIFGTPDTSNILNKESM